MSYRSRAEAAILTGTPPLRSLWWALRAPRTARRSRSLRYLRGRPA